MGIFQTAIHALNYRRFLIPTVGLACITVYGILNTEIGELFGVTLPDIPTWWLFSMGIALFAAYTFLRHAQKLETSLEPKIAIKHPHVHSQAITSVPAIGGGFAINKGRFIKIGIENTSTTSIENCRAFLIRAEKYKDGNLAASAPIDNDPITLAWSRSTGEVEKFQTTLDHEVTRYITVLYAKHDSDKLGFWGAETPNNLVNFFTAPAEYRLFIKVSGRNIKTMQYCLDVIWNGNLDELSVNEQTGKLTNGNR